jgi:hypothetical protein
LEVRTTGMSFARHSTIFTGHARATTLQCGKSRVNSLGAIISKRFTHPTQSAGARGCTIGVCVSQSAIRKSLWDWWLL